MLVVLILVGTPSRSPVCSVGRGVPHVRITHRGRTLVERLSFFITSDPVLHVIVDDEVQLG